MRGMLMFVIFCTVVWIFWMSWQWLRNKNK